MVGSAQKIVPIVWIKSGGEFTLSLTTTEIAISGCFNFTLFYRSGCQNKWYGNGVVAIISI